MWGAKDQLMRLARSLRSARTVELPKDNKAACHYLTSLVIANQYRSLAELLTSSSFDVNYVFGRSQRILLQIAANVGCFECLDILLKEGSSPNYQDISGCTALHLAARNGHQKCVQKLLEYKADVNIHNNDGFAMVHWLAANGRSEILATVLPYITNIDIEDLQGQTALHIASLNGHKITVQSLLTAGTNVNHQSASGYTPLHSACSHGQRDIVALLLKHGAIHKPDKSGVSPIDLCIKNGYGEPLQLLLSHFPRLNNSLVPVSVKYLDKKHAGVLKCLSFLCTKGEFGGEKLLITMSEYVANAGFQLLSVTSDYKLQAKLFRQSIQLLCELCSVAVSNSVSNSPVPIPLRLKPPQTVSMEKVFEPFDALWTSLEEWLVILQEEVTKKKKKQVSIATEEQLNDLSKSSKRESLQMLLITSDRLCAIIKGFYSCLKCKQCPTSKLTESPKEFEAFVHRHREVLEFLIDRDPKIIFNHFTFLLDCPSLMSQFLGVIKSQPLDDRLEWFYDNLHAHRMDDINALNRDLRLSEPIQVRRQFVFEDSCKALEDLSSGNLKLHVGVQFAEEEGMGIGVLREWLDILSNEIFNPEYALFIHSPDGATFQPNSNSAINPDHLNYFMFAGRIFGLALYHKQLVNVYFTRSFYKHVLGIPVCYTDVASIDPEYAKNLQWILDNDVTDLGLALTFSVETDVFGMMQEIELKPGGATIPVTQDNKAEYVQLVTELRMTRAIQPQIEAFRKGFQEFIPASLVQIFSEDELELLLSGTVVIDTDDWRRNTQYASGFQDDSQVVEWFWECVGKMPEEQKTNLLQFCTGSSRVPYGGFANLHGSKFVITRTNDNVEDLPTASTCINMLKLPEYSSYKQLSEKLLIAVQCGSQGYART